jgi:hypothetical protein
MKLSCSLCSSGMRAPCPALNAPICGPCCGSKRNVSIQCTADCRYNPFSPVNYDGWLRVDSVLSQKMMKYLARFYDDMDFTKTIQEMMYADDSPHAYQMGGAAAAYYLFFRKPLRDGRVVAAVWRQEGWEGLDNDERSMMGFRLNAAPAIVEVQKVLDHQSMECRNLLQPERGTFIVLDREMAKNMDRFTRLWMWLANYPYFSRPACDPLEVPENVPHPLMEEILADTLQERNKNNGASRDEVLSRNFGRYARFICDESRKARERLLNAMDFYECKAFYKIKGDREDVKRILDSKPDFRFDDAAKPEGGPGPGLSYGWLRRGESKTIEKKMDPSFHHDENDEIVGVLGHIFLGERDFIFRTMSRLKFSFAQKMIKKYWGDLLEFHRESVVDVAKIMAQKTKEDSSVVTKPNPTPAEHPSIPKEVKQKIMLGHYHSHYERFLDDSVPALDGMTPRTAAKSAQMRPRLVELMKDHVHNIDTMRKNSGFPISIDWVLDELDLSELK